MVLGRGIDQPPDFGGIEGNVKFEILPAPTDFQSLLRPCASGA